MKSLTLVQGPQDPVVSLAEAKAHLNVDTSAADNYIEMLIRAATTYLDGRDGILGRALRPQTWRLELPIFPITICLPLPPTISVDQIDYLDTSGTLTVLDPSAYTVLDGGSRGAKIVQAAGYTWPATYDAGNAAGVVFTAGYVSTSSPENEAVPDALRLAILMLLSSWYDKPAERDIPEVVASLIAPYRLTFLG